MKLMIDIPEYIYKLCQGHGDPVYKYIANGRPILGDVEVWNGIHSQTIAPAGTFEKIYNEADEEV